MHFSKSPTADITVIKVDRNRISIPLRELIKYQDLLFFLTWKNVIVKYKQTLIGISWALIQPIVQMVVFSIIFGKFARIPSDNVPYPIFVYSALIPWTFFANSITACNNSIINHAGLINKVYFPRLLIPLSAIGSHLIDFGLSFFVLIGIIIYYHFTLSWGLFMIIPLTLLVLFTAMGFGILISALSGIYRDIRHIVPYFLTIWLFLTPVIYPRTILGVKFEFMILLNPLTGIVGGFRSAILQQPFDWTAIGWSIIITCLFFILGIFYFNKAEDRFADII